MLIDNLNLNLLRVFEAVYKHENMTKAAQELYMTQPGVSQNIKTLEDILEVTLFDRLNRKLLPTQKADELYKTCIKSLYAIEDSLSKIVGDDGALSGTIKIGLPVEFGNNVVLPKLCEFATMHPGINFEVSYGIPAKMNDLLVSGQLDFAIVDDYLFDSSIETHSVGREELLLCLSKDYAKKNKLTQKSALKELVQLDFMDYGMDAPILNMWFRHHFKNFKSTLRMRASVMDVQGLARLVINNLGAAVLPHHMVEAIKQRELEIFIFKGPGKTLVNEMSLALLKNRSYSKETKAAINFLKENLKK